MAVVAIEESDEQGAGSECAIDRVVCLDKGVKMCRQGVKTS